jgi:hypothetical protein
MSATTKRKLLLVAIIVPVLGAAALVPPASGLVSYSTTFRSRAPVSKVDARAQAARPNSDKFVDTSRFARLEPRTIDEVKAVSTPNPETETMSDAVGTGRQSPAAHSKSDQGYDNTSQATVESSKSDEADGKSSSGRAAASQVDKVSAFPAVSERTLSVADSKNLQPATQASEACLIKQHLATGAVLFKDSCTKEWAINSTHAVNHRLDRKCLRKSRQPDGVVMFQDVCTGEWAMNTARGIERPEPKD